MEENIYREVWNEAIKIIEENYISSGAQGRFVLYISQIKYISDSDNLVTVSVPSQFYWKMAEKNRCINEIKDQIFQLTGCKIDIDYKIDANERVIDNPEEQLIEKNTVIDEGEKIHPQLSCEYTFDNFISGDLNIYPYSVAKAAASDPGTLYNPVLIYGGVGLGKTHLMEAIGNYIYAQDKKKKICCIGTEPFINEFTCSIRDKTTMAFKEKYRTLDVLLLDDIQFLAKKESTQEELFNIFNALYSRHCQMVFTCDRPLNEITGFNERLKTRFTRGVNLELLLPDYENRMAIIEKKLFALKVDLPNEVKSYIAESVKTNIRDLEACVIQTASYTACAGKPIDTSTAKSLLSDIITNSVLAPVSIDSIKKAVSEYYDVAISEINGVKRSARIVKPRQIAIYIARQLTDSSLTEIGDNFGKDHTTIMHAITKVEDQIKTDKIMADHVADLMKKIKESSVL